MTWTIRLQVMTLILYAFVSAHAVLFWFDYRQEKIEQRAIRASLLSLSIKTLTEKTLTELELDI